MTKSTSPMLPSSSGPVRGSRWLMPSVIIIAVVVLVGILYLIGLKRLHAMAWDIGWHEGGRFANPAISVYRSPIRVRAYTGPVQAPSWTGVPWQTCIPIIYYKNEAQAIPPLRSPTPGRLGRYSPQGHGPGMDNSKGGPTDATPVRQTVFVSGNQKVLLPQVLIAAGQKGPAAVTFQCQSIPEVQTIYENVGLAVDGCTSGKKADFWSRMLHMPLQHRVATWQGMVSVTLGGTVPDAQFGVEYAQSLCPTYQWSVLRRPKGGSDRPKRDGALSDYPRRDHRSAQYCQRAGPPTLNFCVSSGPDLMVVPGYPPGTQTPADSKDHADPLLRLKMVIPPGSPEELLAQARKLIRRGAAHGELEMFLAGPYGGVRGGTDFQEAAALLRAAASAAHRGPNGRVPAHIAARIQADRCWFRILRVGDYTGSLRTLERLALRSPDDPQILLMIATLEASRQYAWQTEEVRKHGPDYGAALRAIAAATRVSPSYAAAWWVAGQLHALAGNRAAVIGDDRRFVALASHIDMFPYLYDYKLMAQRVAATRNFLGVVDRGSSGPAR